MPPEQIQTLGCHRRGLSPPFRELLPLCNHAPTLPLSNRQATAHDTAQTHGDLIPNPKPCALRARVPSRPHASSAAQTGTGCGQMGTGLHLSSLAPQIKTHREHRQEPRNLMDLIMSVPQAPCGTQDTPFPFRLAVFLRGVRKKRKAELHFPRPEAESESEPGTVLGLAP